MYKIKINDKIDKINDKIYKINDKINEDDIIIRNINSDIKSSSSPIKDINNIINVDNRLPTSYLTIDLVYNKLYKILDKCNEIKTTNDYEIIHMLVYTSLYICDYYVQKEDIRFVSMYVCRKYIDKNYKYNRLKYHIIMDIYYNNVYDIFIKNTTVNKQPRRCIIL